MSGTIHLISKSRKKYSITNTSFYHSPLLPKKHNHVEMKIDNFKLIYNDPRRFGYFSYFKNISGNQGSFQKNFNVYQRENKKCLKYSCKGTINKKFISNRSSFFCNLCQK